MEQQEQKSIITGLTVQELAKLINAEQAFKFSNWVEWLENEKSKRRHNTWVLILSIIIISLLFSGFIYGATINLISKETLTALLGTVSGAGLSIFVKHIEKSEKH